MIDLPYPQQPRNKGGCGFLLIVLTLLFSLLFITTWKEQSAYDSNPIPAYAVIIAMLICFGPLLMIGISLIKQDGRNHKKWSQQIERWQQARQVWLTLRYCHRDHVVYQWPNVTIQPTMVRKFVYDQVNSLPIMKGPRSA